MSTIEKGSSARCAVGLRSSSSRLWGRLRWWWRRWGTRCGYGRHRPRCRRCGLRWRRSGRRWSPRKIGRHNRRNRSKHRNPKIWEHRPMRPLQIIQSRLNLPMALFFGAFSPRLKFLLGGERLRRIGGIQPSHSQQLLFGQGRELLSVAGNLLRCGLIGGAHTLPNV
jgi:hypothetical protein